MRRKVRDVKDSLTDKFGFGPAPGDAHLNYARLVPNVGQVSTHFSHSDVEVGETRLAAMAGQLRVTGSYLKGMLDCKNTCEAWIKQIQESPVGPLARFHKPKKRE
jgi:hypothetical protein